MLPPAGVYTAKFWSLVGSPQVVGGATLVANLLNEDLIDELRLIVHPVVLGQGQALFGGVHERIALALVQAKPTKAGTLIVTYRV